MHLHHLATQDTTSPCHEAVSCDIRSQDRVCGFNVMQTRRGLCPIQVPSRLLSGAGNHLAVLPAEIESLQDLKYLNVMGNSLRSLPPEIGQLAKLSR